jgi:hypothetical protein
MMRPSTEARIERAGAAFIRGIVGIALMVVGFSLDYLEYREPPPTHTTHLLLWTGLAVLGILLLPTIFDALFPRVQKVFILIFPNGLPLPGGRRQGDPPAGGKEP